MFSKNLKYYRLKNAMTMKELAVSAGVTPMAISNYESGTRQPSMDIMKALANALNVRVSDFLTIRNEKLQFVHGEFRKNASLSKTEQEFVRESVEEYFNRFYTVLEILGGEVLPNAPNCHSIKLTQDSEIDAAAMRQHLGLAADGPIDDLITILENKGILVFVCYIDNNKFSGMNGFVNDRPYIVINGNMSAERNRSTIAHELAHLLFDWTDFEDEKEIEKIATSISGAFLLPQKDAIRELGLRRSKITSDMILVCKEYGVSMYLLVTRAKYAKIVTDRTATDFYIAAGQHGWRSNEPSRIDAEKPILFEQLVYRAVNEEYISIQRGAELLKQPYADVAANCRMDGV